MLALLGIAVDHDRMVRLAARLEEIGYPARVGIVGASADAEAAGGGGDAGGDGEGDRGGDGGGDVGIVCWTASSVALPAGAALHARAIALKEANLYLGLLLDRVTPPAAVQTAQDVDVSGWDEPDQPAELTPLIAALLDRTEGAGQAGIIGILRRSLRALSDMLAAIRRRLTWLTRLLGAGLLLTTASFFFDILGTQDALCAPGWMEWPCRTAGLGNLPSDAQKSERARARAGDRCEPFDAYLNKHGFDAPLAEEAKHRLSRERDFPVERRETMLIAVPMPMADIGSASEAEARVALGRRQADEARAHCRANAQSFSGEWAPGVPVPTSAVRCTPAPGGTVCHSRLSARCSFRVADTVKRCPR